MKKLLFGLIATVFVLAISSCENSDNSTEYENFRSDEAPIDKGTPPPKNGITKGTPPLANG